MSSPLLVMHSVGDSAGATPWKTAFGDAGWDGEVVAFDLPGHGAADPPEGGHMDFVDPAFMAVSKLGLRLHDDGFVAVGVGSSGWAATILAMAGTTQALALVDGVGAPFTTLEERADRRRARLRFYADLASADLASADLASADLASADPASAGTQGNRWDYPIGSHHRLDLAIEALGGLKVPVLLLESPASEATGEQVTQIADAGDKITVVNIDDAEPATVAAAVNRWASRLSLESSF